MSMNISTCQWQKFSKFLNLYNRAAIKQIYRLPHKIKLIIQHSYESGTQNSNYGRRPNYIILDHV